VYKRQIFEVFLPKLNPKKNPLPKRAKIEKQIKIIFKTLWRIMALLYFKQKISQFML